MKKISAKRQKYLRDCAQHILSDQHESDCYEEWCESENHVEANWEGNANKHIYAKAMVASYTPQQLQKFRIRDYDEDYLIENGLLDPNSVSFIKDLKKKNSMSCK